MKNTRLGARRIKEEIANAGVLLHENQAPTQEQVSLGGQALVNPPVMLDREIIQALLNMTQFMSTQALAMMAKANREGAPHVNQNASTTASHLWDFTRMNSPMLFGSKINEDPQKFLDEVYKIFYVMGSSSNENAELAAYRLKDVAQTCNGKSIGL